MLRTKAARQAQKIGLLVSERYFQSFGDRLLANGDAVDFIVMPRQTNTAKYLSYDSRNVLPPEDLDRITCGFASSDMESDWDTMLCFMGALERAPNLRWLQISWVGVDFPFVRPLLETATNTKRFVVTNAAGTNAPPIATSVMAGMLALHRRLNLLLRAQVEHRWVDKRDMPRREDIQGKTALIFGFGAIGQRVGALCRAFDMNVVGVQRSAPDEKALATANEIVHPDDLASAITTADFCVIACPLTEETEGKFDREMLAHMKPDSFLLNVGRAAVVDEEALLDCLRVGARRLPKAIFSGGGGADDEDEGGGGGGGIAGAYIDVFSTEPLPASSELWRLPNVIVSPHDSQSCVDNDARVHRIFRENLRRFACGDDEKLTNQVWPYT